MYVHSVKVPRLYKESAKVLEKIKENGGSVKNLIYESKHRNKKALCALVNETLRHLSSIDLLIEKIELLTKESRFNVWLARILIAELLWGKKTLSDTSTPLKTILSYRNKLEKHKAKLIDTSTSENVDTKVNKPRVVRINTIVTTTENAVNDLKDADWKLVPFTGKSYEEFVSQTSSLGSDEFMVDLHFKELLQFPCKAEFYRYAGYKNGSIVLQDKASYLSSFLLNPEPGSVVLDMCAAPGIKTSHLAALMKNQGMIFAVERDVQRFKALNIMVKKLQAKCVKTINKDVLTVTNKECPNVKYILVDPSCSGSGMTNRNKYGNEPEATEERLKKLAGFQIKILKHALRNFPQAQKVVYSTCSVYPMENEYVIQEVLKSDLDFKLVDAHSLLKGPWKSNNEDENWKDISVNCLSMKPEKDLTNGFFVAVFERFQDTKQKKPKEKSEVNVQEKPGEVNVQEKQSGKKKNKKVKGGNQQAQTIAEEEKEKKIEGEDIKSKSSKKAKRQSTNVEDSNPASSEKKKKFQKDVTGDTDTCKVETPNANKIIDNATSTGKKKQKSHKKALQETGTLTHTPKSHDKNKSATDSLEDIIARKLKHQRNSFEKGESNILTENKKSNKKLFNGTPTGTPNKQAEIPKSNKKAKTAGELEEYFSNIQEMINEKLEEVMNKSGSEFCAEKKSKKRKSTGETISEALTPKHNKKAKNENNNSSIGAANINGTTSGKKNKKRKHSQGAATPLA